MNYLKEINAFHDEVELNSLSASASLLWYVLMQFNNKTGWKKEFTVPTAAILVKSGLSESSFLRARKELEEKGYILFQSGSRHQTPTYQMISQVKDKEIGQVEDIVKERVTDETEDSVTDSFKRKERKRKEGEGGGRNPFAFYEQNFGVLTPFMAEKLTDWCRRISDELVMEAMKIATQHNKLFFNYCEGILKRWENQQVRTLADVERVESKTPHKKRKKEERASELKRMVNEYRKERHA
ncbi:DnaD domain protein [Halobacillus litoralis]|uniref:DnaD domain protein n=1 Tax=Halobacillus litoralis TaxID=45668 RepID=A0A410MFG5_9BACI|nr:DnaD domain protein [Halobacillus litoralis]QAS53461.1 DnaD domain protein [Halobacillus litoralis]